MTLANRASRLLVFFQYHTFIVLKDVHAVLSADFATRSDPLRSPLDNVNLVSDR